MPASTVGVARLELLHVPHRPGQDFRASLRFLLRPLILPGFQHLVLEFARNHLGVHEAAHQETDPDAEQPVVAALACSLVGEVRPVTPVPGTRMAEICGLEPFDGFHFCSYGVNLRYRDMLVEAGLTFSAFAPDAGVEAVELEGHPFYLGTLFQPQMTSLEGGPVPPLVLAFLEAAST